MTPAPTAEPPRLRISGVRRRFEGAWAVNDVSFEVAAGEVLCLLGPSGCGKSTTLRIAAGVDRQTEGVVEISGEVVSDARRHLPPEKRSVGLMFQDFALFPHLTALENVAFGLKGADRLERAAQELARVGLADHGPRYPHQLSGGEQQRVALARAIAPKPRVLLMDEPFSSLDHRLRDEVRDQALALLKEDGAAVVLVTHDPDEALRMADRIALMRGGRVVQLGAPYHIYNNPVDRRAAAFFSDLNVVHGVVAEQQTETPFGRFLTPGLVDGADVEIIIRPQHLRLSIGESAPEPSQEAGVPARGLVRRARFLGAQSFIEAQMDHDGGLLRATAPGALLPQTGAPVWLSMRRDRCFVFPCMRQSRVEDPYLVKSDGGSAAHAAP